MKYCGSLHNHTHYSNETLRDCINTVPGLIDLAIKLGLEKSNLTKAINSIEELDLISKTKKGRNVFYFLTSKGKKYDNMIRS